MPLEGDVSNSYDGAASCPSNNRELGPAPASIIAESFSLHEHASVCLGSKVVVVDEKAAPREADFDVSLTSPTCRSAMDSAGLGGVSVSVERSIV